MTNSDTQWPVLGQNLPKNCVVFFCQVAIIFTIVVTSIINLSLQTGDDKLWIALLSSSIGYILPNPTLKHNGG